MNVTEKFRLMHAYLSEQLVQATLAVDAGGGPVALAAGLAVAKVWLDEKGIVPDWPGYRARLATALKSLLSAPDKGEPTQFGLWDGLMAAAAEAGRIDAGVILPQDADAVTPQEGPAPRVTQPGSSMFASFDQQRDS